MNREKQIEEIANIINEMDDRNAHYYDEYMRECEAFADANAIAKVLYDAGYHKQSEGEWVAKEKIIRSITALNYTCSVCGVEGRCTPYCPNCGAKMKSR